MSSRELEQQLEHLERLFDEIVASLDDPDTPDNELRDQIRTVVEKPIRSTEIEYVPPEGAWSRKRPSTAVSHPDPV